MSNLEMSYRCVVTGKVKMTVGQTSEKTTSFQDMTDVDLFSAFTLKYTAAVLVLTPCEQEARFRLKGFGNPYCTGCNIPCSSQEFETRP